MNKLKLICGGAAAVLALLQFTNPARTNPAVKHDFLAATSPPGRLAALFRRACYDCHSYETKWPWYSRIAPINSPARKVAASSPAPADATATMGRPLFLKDCAHCHGADAHGDEGPDLHNLDWTDEQITTRIQNGKKGQMTSFAGKLSAEQIGEIINYLRTLR